MIGQRTVIEKRELTKNLVHKVAITNDEKKVVLVVDYMDGHFIIERSFRNNYIGLSQLKQE